MKPALLAIALVAVPVAAAPPATAPGPITIEHYYRIKWGSDLDFKRLYRANHEPILREMQKAGFILSMKTDVPFTHMAGGQRWDMRVTISYRDAEAAVLVGGAFDEAFEAGKARLYPDAKKLDADEARRFALLEEHWDVIVIPSGM
jgi:hypothetical protein